MAPETIIGAASPVYSNGQDLYTTIKAKETEAMTALVRSIAGRRSPEAIKLAEATITDAKAVSAEEARAAGLVDFIAPNLQDLLKQLDGYRVEIEAGTRTLHTVNATVSELPVDIGEQILDVLVSTDVVFLLLALGLLAILIELSAPGGWVAGFTGVVALALAVYGMGVLSVNWFGAIFLALAFVLFILDIKTTAHGALTVAGIGSFILGSLLLFNSPDVPQFQRVSVPLVVTVAIMIGVCFAIVVGFALRAQKKPLSMGQQTLVGASGNAKTNIDRHGQVEVKSEWGSAELAEGAEPILSGDAVIVESVDGLRLKVHKA